MRQRDDNAARKQNGTCPGDGCRFESQTIRQCALLVSAPGDNSGKLAVDEPGRIVRSNQAHAKLLAHIRQAYRISLYGGEVHARCDFVKEVHKEISGGIRGIEHHLVAPFRCQYGSAVPEGIRVGGGQITMRVLMVINGRCSHAGDDTQVAVDCQTEPDRVVVERVTRGIVALIAWRKDLIVAYACDVAQVPVLYGSERQSWSCRWRILNLADELECQIIFMPKISGGEVLRKATQTDDTTECQYWQGP